MYQKINSMQGQKQVITYENQLVEDYNQMQKNSDLSNLEKMIEELNRKSTDKEEEKWEEDWEMWNLLNEIEEA